VVSAADVPPPEKTVVVDGYWIQPLPPEKQAEANNAACLARVGFDQLSEPFLLAESANHPFTVQARCDNYMITMRKRLWPLPFTVRLDDFRAEFHPGTMKPASFESDITRIEDGREAKVRIRMNEPMRYEGLTFFQASWGPQGAAPGTPLFSVFEVVRNPADKWPEYSLYIVTAGLAVHFILKLIQFVAATTRTSPRHD
jgi:hypothetical protein